jgi:hypothetical protein
MVFPDPRSSIEARGSGPPVGLYGHARQHAGESIVILGYQESETGMGNSPASRLGIHTGTRPYINRNHILPPPLEPATMTPTYTASDDPLHRYAQSHSGCLIAPNIVPSSSPSHDGTIDPSLLMFGDHELLSQYASSSIPTWVSGDSHDQRSSPAPSISAGVWMGYSGDQPSTSAPPSPTSPTVGHTVSPLEV